MANYEIIDSVVSQTALQQLEDLDDRIRLTYGTMAIAFAAVVGAMGAAQIAMIASKQIPQYAEGTDFHKGGLAIVGDVGKSEAVILPSGKVWQSPATDTLVNLPRGTEVLPDYSKLLANAFNAPINPFVFDDDGKIISGYDDILRSNTKKMTSQLDAINVGITKIRKNSMYTENMAKIQLLQNRWKW
jgi:hypothetical protein